jgi:hypothetical protein
MPLDKGTACGNSVSFCQNESITHASSKFDIETLLWVKMVAAPPLSIKMTTTKNMANMGIVPRTFALLARRSNQLS